MRSLALLSLLIFTQPSQALLNSRLLEVTNSPHTQIQIKLPRQTTLCSGTFVSENTLLTAAHCLDPLLRACLRTGKCARQKLASAARYELPIQTQILQIDRLTSPDNHESYSILIHPRYQANQLDSAFDVALIILPHSQRAQHWLPVAKNLTTLKFTADVYGAGMRKAQLVRQSDHSLYNRESQSGPLQVTRAQITSDGISAQSIARLRARRTQKNLFELELKQGAQLLSSDSGGALVHAGKLIGVSRNFTFSFAMTDLHTANRQRSSVQANSFPVEGKSTFTLVTNASHQQFLSAAERHGGKVHND